MRPGQMAIVTGVSTVVLGAGWSAGLLTEAHNAPPSLKLDSASGSTTGAVDPTTSASTTPAVTPSADAAATQSPAATETTQPAETTPAGPTGTFNGGSVHTKYGDYQAAIVVDNGVITAVNILQQGDNDRETKDINARAIPTLVERVLTAQTWQVDGVSGASYTSPALLTSIHDAMSQAGL